MADLTQKLPENVAGQFYVDATCIDCDLCRETAPQNFRATTPRATVTSITSPRTPPSKPPAWRPWKNALSRPSATMAEQRIKLLTCCRGVASTSPTSL